MNTQNPMEQHLITLTPHRAVIDSEQFDDLIASIEQFKKSVAGVREEGRNLRIAVVGQMKAGKSSFLNAAFFGHDMLPKADTPMTAALTKIVYSPTPHAEVMFYTADDWRDIEQRAQDYHRRYKEEEQRLMTEMQESSSPFAKPSQARCPSKQDVNARISVELKASAELVDKAQAMGLNVAAYVGQTEVLNADNNEALAKALHNYVGSGGKFTAITKMIVLHTDDKRLEGLEIIDTPGFNDPVVSRGHITRSYLGQCDVIFLLSSLSQFLTAADMSLLREQLSEAGINEKAIFLVGSQRDVALRQDAGLVKQALVLAEKYPQAQRDAAKVAAMISLLDNKMTKHAAKTLDDQISQPNTDDKTRRILQAVKQIPPHFISAWTWLVAEKLPAFSSDDDREQFAALCRDTGYTFNEESLRQLSNITFVRESVLRQGEQKEQLIAGKERELYEGLQAATHRRLEEMRLSLEARQVRVRDGNIADLAKQEQDALTRLNDGRARLEDVFDDQVARIQTKFAQLKTEIRAQSLRYARVEVIRETSTEEYEATVTKKFLWVIPYDSTETRTRTVVSHYASVQDAIEQIERYAHETAKSLQDAIIGCVNMEVLRRTIGQAAMSLFDTGSADFDGQWMLIEVNKSLRKITIPEIEFGSKDYASNIIKSFGSSRVSESEIDSLKEAQRVALAAIINDLNAEVDRKVQEITKRLEETGSNFVVSMTHDIQAGLAQLRDEIGNKEESLKNIAQAILAVESCLN
jgi:GTPase Era involved in 16S rRNA processing